MNNSSSILRWIRTTSIPKFIRTKRRFFENLGAEREFEDAEQYLHINKGNGNLFNKITIESDAGTLIYERRGIDWFCRFEEQKGEQDG